MLMRTLSVLAFLILSFVALACSQKAEVRSGMIGEARADADGDVQVALADLPDAVQATITQQVGRGSINEIERSPAGNYEVDATGPDGQFEFVVSASGEYLGAEDNDGDSESVDDDDSESLDDDESSDDEPGDDEDSESLGDDESEDDDDDRE